MHLLNISVEYIKILFYAGFSFVLSFCLLLLSLKITSVEYDAEKLSSYECGFLPTGDARQPFHVRFYIVGILFILFDLEIVFLFPWAIALEDFKCGSIYFVNFLIIPFLLFLIIGFFYEWRKGILDWE